MSDEFLYFCSERGDDRVVRVGYSADIERRLASHAADGRSMIALMPGSEDYEGRIHRYFASLGARADGYAGSTSHYVGDEIWSYVAWLAHRGYATTSFEERLHLPSLPWSVIDPANVDPAFDDADGQRAMFRPVRRARVIAAAAFAHHLSLTDEWYSPADIVESARAVMGGIDLDPASCPRANETVRATHYYSQKIDGLTHPWAGRVWMNPPYGRTGPAFAGRLLEHLANGAVSEATALFNLGSMSARWFAAVLDASAALLVTRGRLEFTPGDPSQHSGSPSTGSVIVYFGPHVDRFAVEFAKHGTTLIVLRR